MSIEYEKQHIQELKQLAPLLLIVALVFFGTLALFDSKAKRADNSKTLEERVNALKSAQRCECDLCLGY